MRYAGSIFAFPSAGLGTGIVYIYISTGMRFDFARFNLTFREELYLLNCGLPLLQQLKSHLNTRDETFSLTSGLLLQRAAL